MKSPNPAFAQVDVPIASTFMLSTKSGREAYVEPVIEGGGYRFTVKVGKPKDAEAAKNGTKLSRSNFRCLLSGEPISGDYIKSEGQAGRMSAKMMAIVAEGERGRVYLPPTDEMEVVARQAKPEWKPDIEFFQQALGFRVGNYGMTKWSDLFTDRQLVALTTFCDLVLKARERAKCDALAAELKNDEFGFADGGNSATVYADSVAAYLGLGVSKLANRSATLNFWDTKGENVQQVFARQVLPIIWDYVEGNPLSNSTGNFTGQLEYLISSVLSLPAYCYGTAFQQDATTQTASSSKLVSTDPPYFDNIGYADLSDFFYIWLRRSLQPVFPTLFSILVVPKSEELVATPARHGGRERAETFFLNGMARAMHQLTEQVHPSFPLSIFYAFKQSESEGDGAVASTGWETFLDAVIRAGFSISGTWPVRTEYTGNLKTKRSALASSIVLICHPRTNDAPTATRREFVTALKIELPNALTHLQRSNIAPVDLAQSAIGPGMSVYTRYAKVLDAAGKPLSVREALALINQILDEVLAEQEGDFDADSRWALAWFDHSGFAAGEYGVAETLSKAKNTSISGMVNAGILTSQGGKVRLLRPDELPESWDPTTDPRLTVWEMVHHLIRVLEAGGESAAAELMTKLGSQAEVARELAYRLYTLCERKKRAAEALSYNGLVQSWPEIQRLAREKGTPRAEQGGLFE